MMAQHTNDKGQRAVRIKKDIYDILTEFPEGLTSLRIHEELQNKDASKNFIGSVRQLGQILRGVVGVVKTDGIEYAADGQSYRCKKWVLQYPEEFLEWLEVGNEYHKKESFEQSIRSYADER